MIKYLDIISDDRGHLVEVLTYQDLPETKFGHLHLTVIKPGKTRGGHYHKTKGEWFFLIKGNVDLVLEDIKGGEKETIAIKGEKPFLINISSFIKHTLYNKGDEDAYLIVYNEQRFDKENPDTYEK